MLDTRTASNYLIEVAHRDNMRKRKACSVVLFEYGFFIFFLSRGHLTITLEILANLFTHIVYAWFKTIKLKQKLLSNIYLFEYLQFVSMQCYPGQ